MNLIYLLSGEFDYSLRMYNGDSGKEYAQSLGLNATCWRNYAISFSGHDIFFDSRLTEQEIPSIKEFIISQKKVLVLMSVTDPYFEHEDNNPYIKMLFDLKEYKHVRIVSKYQPEEVTKNLFAAFGEDRFLVLNYTYLSKNELPFSLNKKKNKILLSGATDKIFYPLRYRFSRYSDFFPLSLFIDKLVHPGYPDVGQKLLHNVTGNAYLKRLSEYRFMFITPSRCGLEFLKYSEAGYAGTLPIGIAPRTFPVSLRQSMIVINIFFPFWGLLKAFMMSDIEFQDRMVRYRSIFLKERGIDIQRQKLNEFMGKRKIDNSDRENRIE